MLNPEPFHPAPVTRIGGTTATDVYPFLLSHKDEAFTTGAAGDRDHPAKNVTLPCLISFQGIFCIRISPSHHRITASAIIIAL
jgi:hypothetical protein